MIRRMEVLGEGLTSPLPVGFDAVTDPIQVLDIQGLEPIKAALSSTPYATRRGSYPQGSRVDIRNLVLKIGLNPNWATQTMSSLRKLLYGYFMTEQSVKLRFFTDDYPPVDIQGVVESCDPNIFSQDPQMQVSIVCHQPDFIEADYTIQKGLVTNALVDGVPTQYEFDYEGTVPTGFTLRVKHGASNPSYKGPLVVENESPSIKDIFSLAEVEIDTTKYLSLTTIESARRVRTIPYSDGMVMPLLRQKSRNSTWPMLRPGKNLLSVNAMRSGLKFEIVYYNRYGAL